MSFISKLIYVEKISQLKEKWIFDEDGEGSHRNEVFYYECPATADADYINDIFELAVTAQFAEKNVYYGVDPLETRMMVAVMTTSEDEAIKIIESL